MNNYLLADIAVRLNVAGRAYSQKTFLPKNPLTLSILTLLLRQGIIQNFQIKGEKIDVKLKYFKKRPLLKKLELISKPGKRIF
jgi:ribosomal protein S8